MIYKKKNPQGIGTLRVAGGETPFTQRDDIALSWGD